MKVIGLDLSLLATGLCILEGEPGGSPSYRSMLIPGRKTEGIQQSIERLLNTANIITSIVTQESPDSVIIEAPAKNQVWQAAAIGELHGVVKTQLYVVCNVVPLVEQATKMRKAVIGKIERSFESFTDKSGKKKRRVSYGSVLGKSGRAKRATVKDVIERILAGRGLSFPTQDEMDAYVAAKFAWDRLANPS